MALDQEKLALLSAVTQKRLKNLEMTAKERSLIISFSTDGTKIMFHKEGTGKFIASSPLSDFT